MMVTASEPKRGSKSRGAMPRTVVIEAIITGRRRERVESTTALYGSTPRLS